MEILVQQPSRRKGVTRALSFSLVAHVIGCVVFWYYPLIATAIGLRNLEFVEEDYNKAILIDFSKKLSYPGGYLGFRPPEKSLSLEEIKKAEERKRRSEAQRQREKAELEKQIAEEKAREEELARDSKLVAEAAVPEVKPEVKKETYPGGFGKINTSPIKDQVQRLYDAHKTGKLLLPDGKFKVGVGGKINRDGSLTDCKVIIPSGLPEIDRAALAILDAVSESRALGPLADLTSLTMVLSIGDQAELSAVGFTSTVDAAANIVNLANAALLYARFRKADDPASMVIINNLKVTRTGQRVQAIVSMPRATAKDSLAKTMAPSKSE